MWNTTYAATMRNYGIIFICTFYLLLTCDAKKCPLKNELQKCDCDSKLMSMKCLHKGFQSADALQHLSENNHFRNLINITYIGNNIHHLTRNAFGNCSRPHSERSLNALKRLDLSYNNISIIDGKAFHCISNLQHLILNHNEWYVDPHSSRVFSNLPNLHELDLEDTFFSGIHPVIKHLINLESVFNGSQLNKLEVLSLEGNMLLIYSEKLFCKLPNLKILDLANNSITDLKLDAKCMQNITTLLLNNNAILSIDQQALTEIEHMKNLEELDISMNPFQCDCGLKNFVAWVNSPKSAVLRTSVKQNQLKCQIPSPMKGKDIKDLTISELDDVCNNAGKLNKGVQATHIIMAVIFSIIACLMVIIIIMNHKRIRDKCYSYSEPVRDMVMGRRHGLGYTSVTL